MSRLPESEPISNFARAFLRIPVPWTFVLTYLAGAVCETLLRPRWLQGYDFLTPAGMLVFILGAALAASGWLIFNRVDTTRVPGEDSSALVTWGPYRFTRNPMYVGLSVAYLGEAGILHQIIPALLLPFTLVYLNQVVIPLEEKRLHAVFGAEYEQYRNKVRRWL